MYNDHPEGPDRRPLSTREMLITLGCIIVIGTAFFLGVLGILSFA